MTKWIADLARPYTFYTLATASGIAIVKMAWGITDGYQAAAFAGVVLAGASAIYIGKSFENTRISAHSADLEKVRAQATPAPPAEALKPATPAEERSLEDPA
jgi:hypothetical protein